MPKKYTTLRVTEETYIKLVKARGKLELKTGESRSLEKTLNEVLDIFLHT